MVRHQTKNSAVNPFCQILGRYVMPLLSAGRVARIKKGGGQICQTAIWMET
jgi:hypothetical protein